MLAMSRLIYPPNPCASRRAPLVLRFAAERQALDALLLFEQYFRQSTFDDLIAWLQVDKYAERSFQLVPITALA